jgi:FKBP-type peptidyl-prolyl cis-trans isomerase
MLPVSCPLALPHTRKFQFLLMKFKTPYTIALLALGFAISARAADDIKIKVPVAPAKPAAAAPAAAPAVAAPAAAPAAVVYSEAQILEFFGWGLSKQIPLDIFGLTPSQLDSVLKGMAAGALNKELPYDKATISPKVAEWVQKRQAEFMEKLSKENVATANAFFAKLKEKKSVVELPSGLRYEIVAPGTGEYPKSTDFVKVNYTGFLLSGEIFDSSLQRGQPAEFPLDQVIPGWTEGLQKINKGGKIRLFVPSQLAYGEEGRPGIAPNSALIFDVELIDFGKTPSTPPPAAPAAAPAPAGS